MEDQWWFNVVDGLVINKQPYPQEGYIQGPYYVVPGYTYSNGVWTAPIIPDSYYEAINNEKLTNLLRQANAQVNAIQGRIDAINDAIEFGEDEPGWVEELPVRAAQLTAWKRYRVLLNKVTLQAGWAVTVTWPVVPEPYTNEMSSVSPTASLS